jgi:hypothetical protein
VQEGTICNKQYHFSVNLPGLNPGASLPWVAALSPRPRLKFFVTWSERRPEPPV